WIVYAQVDDRPTVGNNTTCLIHAHHPAGAGTMIWSKRRLLVNAPAGEQLGTTGEIRLDGGPNRPHKWRSALTVHAHRCAWGRRAHRIDDYHSCTACQRNHNQKMMIIKLNRKSPTSPPIAAPSFPFA